MAKKPTKPAAAGDAAERHGLSWRGIAVGLLFGGTVVLWLAFVLPSKSDDRRATVVAAERAAIAAVEAERARVETSVRRLELNSRSSEAIRELQTTSRTTFQAQLPQAGVSSMDLRQRALQAYTSNQNDEKQRLQTQFSAVTNGVRADMLAVVSGRDAPAPAAVAQQAVRESNVGAGSAPEPGLSRGMLLLAIYALIALLLVLFTVLHHRSKDKAKIRTYAAYMERTLGFLLGGPLTEGVLQLVGT